MKTVFAALVLLLLCACDPPYEIRQPGWENVGVTPSGGPIYKKHDEKERVTYYATQAGRDGYFIVSVVKDQEGK